LLRRINARTSLLIKHEELESVNDCLSLADSFFNDKVEYSIEDHMELLMLKLKTSIHFNRPENAENHIQQILDVASQIRAQLDSRFLGKAVSNSIRNSVKDYLGYRVTNYKLNPDDVDANEIFVLLERVTYLGIKLSCSNIIDSSQSPSSAQENLAKMLDAEFQALASSDVDHRRASLDKALEAYFIQASFQIELLGKLETDLSTISLTATQALLGDTFLVRYFMLNDSFLVFFVSRKGYQLVEIDMDSEELGSQVAMFLGQIKAKSRKVSESARQLSKILGGIGTYSKGFQKVLIIPDGPLELLPFAAIEGNLANLEAGL